MVRRTRKPYRIGQHEEEHRPRRSGDRRAYQAQTQGVIRWIRIGRRSLGAYESLLYG